MNVPPPSTCHVCGTDLPGNTPLDLCPRCLVRSGVITVKDKAAATVWEETGETLAAGLHVGGGRFALVDQLGEGGMGVVWLAIDEELSKGGSAFFVALKFLAPRIRSDARALGMLREEVLHSRKLRHPRIVSIYDWHALPGEPPFISMEYVEGVNLSQMLSLQPANFMAWPAIAPWVKQLCDALEYAHAEEHIVHRDLKPANMMLNQRSELKLADFGLARASIGLAGEDPAQTQARGTPLYMSPQQMMGHAPHPTDDIYSLGATLYELLTSTPPFYTGANIFKQVIESPPEPIGDRLAQLGQANEIPARVRITIAACLQKEPANRPQSAREVAHRLGLALLEGARPSPQPFLPATDAEDDTAAPARSSHAVPVVLLVALLLMLAGYLFPHSAPLRALTGWFDAVIESTLKEAEPAHPRLKPGLSQLNITVDPAGATVDLTPLAGGVAQHVVLTATNARQFPDLAPGLYKVSSSKDGYVSTNLTVELRPGKVARLVLIHVPLSRPIDSASTLVLTSISPRPVHVRLWDEARRNILREETFVRQSANPSQLATGSYWVEAGLSNLDRTTIRMGQPLRIQAGVNTVDLSFTPCRIHILIDQEVTVTALDQWGTRKNIVLSPWLEGGRQKGYHGWHERATPGQWTYSCSLLPRYEEFLTNLVVAPGTTREFSVRMTPTVSPTPGYGWTNTLRMPLVWFGSYNPGFWACATETTREHYAAFAKATAQKPQVMMSVTSTGWRERGDNWMEPGFAQRDDEPVVGVSWEDATRFCLWLTEQERLLLRTNQCYALPSDEQWSVMAGPQRFPWGPNWPPGSDEVNCAGVEANKVDWYPYWPTLALGEHSDVWARTAPVTAFKPNQFGLYQMGGNVAEWCSDWYRKEMNDPELRTAFRLLEDDGGGETYRVLRGGSWYDHHSNELATATRMRAGPAERHDRYGFRIVLVQETVPAK
jgi:serine/threonine protein kinase/formylglycine-generating enzyme required for sulfatase activity